MPAPADRPTTDDDPQVAAAIAVLADRAALLQRAGGASLLDCFAAIPDPRSKRGVRHELPTILGLCTAAVLSGCVSLVEITDWVTHADQELLGALGARHDPTGRHVPPHPDTIERVLCATRRPVISPAQPGGTRREVSGSDGLPGAERLRGQEHARKAATASRRMERCVAGPARYGESWIA